MTQRGRRSTASLAVVTRLPGQRLSPPRGMAPEAAAVWDRVVASRPSDWFDGGAVDTLAAYCRHVAEFERMTARLDALGPEALATMEGVVLYDKLLAMRARETGAVVNTARQLRLNPRAMYDAQKAATAARSAAADPAARRPWEFDGA
jgi:hypothetical protein